MQPHYASYLKNTSFTSKPSDRKSFVSGMVSEEHDFVDVSLYQRPKHVYRSCLDVEKAISAMRVVVGWQGSDRKVPQVMALGMLVCVAGKGWRLVENEPSDPAN